MLVELMDCRAARRQHFAALQLAYAVEGLGFPAPKDEVEQVREILRVDLELWKGFTPLILCESYVPALSSG
jgi:hypothetical protein